MLNISKERIVDYVKSGDYKCFQILENKDNPKLLLRVFSGAILLGIAALFLPWTQNIRATGYVTSLNPFNRPQTVQALIGGKIEKWYVNEGDIVKAGDTIILISEVKEEYLDPEILPNTEGQIIAKSQASGAYSDKAENLKDQLLALQNTLDIKLQQNDIKLKQNSLYYQSDSLELEAAKVKLKNTKNQLERIKQLYNDGIKPLVDYENKNFEYQDAQAKVTNYTNKLNALVNERQIIENDIEGIKNEYRDKIAKSRSELNSAMSSKFNADADVNKLQSQYNAYSERQANYAIKSPIDGVINTALQTGIGEIIKNGERIVNIVPSNYTLAVEMFIDPVDVPLLDVGEKVRILFDGWPAIVFSGWPNTSYGTFGGKVYMIENNISENGKYRVLVEPDETEESWPAELRIGGGANTITLLKNVSVGYELWRQLNGFPPDYYKKSDENSLKVKAPLKRIK